VTDRRYAQVVLFDGFDLLDAVAPYEVLLYGGEVAGGALTVELVSPQGARDVPSGAGPTLRASGVLDPDRADIVVVPGASGPLDDPYGTGRDTIPQLLARTLDTPLPSLVRRVLHRPGAVVATVCGGSLALAMAGLLEGRHVVTHHLGMQLLEATGAVPVAARLVEDGDLVSAGGVTSGLDLGLYLLERELGPRVARQVEVMFEYERRGTVWRAIGADPLPAATDLALESGSAA
jgi:transcriptional regulator GlxA family with amidase domain